jgi:hypothetical protein
MQRARFSRCGPSGVYWSVVLLATTACGLAQRTRSPHCEGSDLHEWAVDYPCGLASPRLQRARVPGP